jgi:hypothetical protein
MGKSVRGRVLDSVKQEAISGAKCTLFDDRTSFKQITDEVGRFSFEGIEPGVVNLKVMAPGCLIKMLAGLSTEADVDLGDMQLVVKQSWIPKEKYDL